MKPYNDATNDAFPPGAKPQAMKTFPLLVALVLLSAGCVARPGDEPLETATVGTAPDDVAQSPASSDAAPAASSGSGQAASGNSSTNDSEVAPPAPPVMPDATAELPRVDVLAWEGTLSGVGVSPPAGPLCCVWHAVEGEHTDATFDIGPALSGIVIELSWEDTVADLDLQVRASDYVETLPPAPEADPKTHTGHMWSATGGVPGQPDGHVVLTLTDADALALTGTWSWQVGTKVGQAVPFTVTVSLFRGAAPASDYTASPSSNP